MIKLSNIMTDDNTAAFSELKIGECFKFRVPDTEDVRTYMKITSEDALRLNLNKQLNLGTTHFSKSTSVTRSNVRFVVTPKSDNEKDFMRVNPSLSIDFHIGSNCCQYQHLKPMTAFVYVDYLHIKAADGSTYRFSEEGVSRQFTICGASVVEIVDLEIIV